MRNLVKYRPYTLSLFDDIDRIFHSFLDEDNGVNTNLPRVDVRDEKNSYVLEAELPGTTEKDIDVKVENDLLQISTKKEEEKEEKEEGYLMQERRSASYHRSFMLPKDTDREKIEANFKNGLLTLTIPKTEVAKPRQIEVKNA